MRYEPDRLQSMASERTMMGLKSHFVLLPGDVKFILRRYSPKTWRFAPYFAVVSDCCPIGLMSDVLNPREKKKSSEIAEHQLFPESMRARTVCSVILSNAWRTHCCYCSHKLSLAISLLWPAER
jgi:hypothetical protein